MAALANPSSLRFSTTKVSISKSTPSSKFFSGTSLKLGSLQDNSVPYQSPLTAHPVRSAIYASSTQVTPAVSQSSMMTTSSRVPTIVEVDLRDRSYPIYIGSGLLDQPDLLQRFFLLFQLLIF